MKIKINYDLLDKIQEAKTGFSLQKTVKPILGRTTMSSIIGIILIHPIDRVVKYIPFYLFCHALIKSTADIILSSSTKDRAISSLKLLSSLLNTINVNTDSELILDSYKYKTEYEFNKDNDSKELIQKKYIMVPIRELGEEKEILLVQEHVIGTKKYSLSCGSPKEQKVFKLALNPM